MEFELCERIELPFTEYESVVISHYTNKAKNHLKVIYFFGKQGLTSVTFPVTAST